MANRRIDWDRQALRQFNKAILYIAEESVQNAENVRTEIIEKIEALVPNPEKFPPINIRLRMMAIIAHLNCTGFGWLISWVWKWSEF
jgi:plasmid stabilization system protein ParE